MCTPLPPPPVPRVSGLATPQVLCPRAVRRPALQGTFAPRAPPRRSPAPSAGSAARWGRRSASCVVWGPTATSQRPRTACCARAGSSGAPRDSHLQLAAGTGGCLTGPHSARQFVPLCPCALPLVVPLHPTAPLGGAAIFCFVAWRVCFVVLCCLASVLCCALLLGECFGSNTWVLYQPAASSPSCPWTEPWTRMHFVLRA